MTIAENIARIRANMDAAAREAGRDPKEILLVGASKMNDAAACREAVAAGIDALGENRVQEMVQKLEQHAYDGAPLHFIGHLQRNKVKQVVGHVALIQSVGSLELLDEIEKVAAARGLVQDILLEVNIGREAAKSGFAPEKVLPAAEAALERTHVRVRGLMTIPPADAHSFRKNILERGGTQDGAELYRNFRGKDPDITPMMVKRGLIKPVEPAADSVAAATPVVPQAQ